MSAPTPLRPGRMLEPAVAAGAPAAAPGVMRRMSKNTSGSVIVLAAILFPIILGGIGLGVETSFWYMTQRKLQHAADVAAHAAAVRNRAGDTLAEIQTAALHIAVSSGFLSQRGTITVSLPPSKGAFTADSDAVEVALSESWPRWLTAVFASGSVTISARAVARISGGVDACILALSPVANGAFNVAASTDVVLNGCNVASNSVSPTSFLMGSSSAQLTTGCAYAVGQASVTAGLMLTQCPTVRINSPITRDPYRNVPAPAIIGPCENSNVGRPGSDTTITPTDIHPSGMKSLRYCNGLNIKGSVTFLPGLYIIEGGDFTINGGVADATSAASIAGSGVTFYLTNTVNLKLIGNVTLSLSAPKSGAYSGILFFGARDATTVSHDIAGTSGSTLQGAIYAPASSISFKGNSTVTEGCTQVVARLVSMTGNSTLQISCANAGTKPILANEGIALVE